MSWQQHIAGILRVLLIVSFVLMMTATATDAAAQSSSGGQASFRQARRTIQRVFVSSSLCPEDSARHVRITYDELRIDGWSFRYSDYTGGKVERNTAVAAHFCGEQPFYNFVLKSKVQKKKHSFGLADWRASQDAYDFLSAFEWLIANAATVHAQLQETREKFQKAASDWRAATAKPPMPDVAHTHKVIAENAVQEKNFDKAIDEYEAALEIFPTWPEGQFNAALLCGETGDYDCAVEHMQDYLDLVPDAADAQAAKDKIIIWRDKLGEHKPGTR